MTTCVFISSFRRFPQLFNGIRGLRLQTHQPDHVRLVLRDYTDFETAKIVQELERGGFQGRCDLVRAPNHGSQFDNIYGHEMFPRNRPMLFDLYLKMDDDDIYTDDYLKSVVEFHRQRPEILLSCQPQVELWAFHNRNQAWASLSGNTLSMTPAFLVPFLARMDEGGLAPTRFEDAALMRHVQEAGASIGWRPPGHVLYIRHATNVSPMAWPTAIPSETLPAPKQGLP